MKWILAILVFISVSAIGQVDDTTKYISYPYQYGMKIPRLWAPTTMIMPYGDTTGKRPGKIGAFMTCTCDGNVYRWDGSNWVAFGGTSLSLTNIGTGFRWVKTPGGQIKSVIPGYGINIDSSADELTISADTSEANHLVTTSDLNDAKAEKQNQFVINIKDYGAKGDGKKVLDGNITGTTNILTSATASFTANDVGKLIIIIGAGTSNTDLRTTIAGFTNSTTVTLTDNAVVSVVNAVCWYGTNDRPAILSAIAAVPANGGTVIFPTGFYYCRGGAITLEKQIQFIGFGHHETYQEAATSIMTDSLAGDFIRVRSIVTFRDISVDNLNINSTPTGGCGIALNASNGASILNSSVRGFYDNIRTDSAGHWLIDGLWSDGAVNSHVHITASTAAPDYGDPTITNSFINATIRDGTNGILQHACGGLKISNVKFNHDGLGHQMGVQLYLDITATTSDLLVTNCSFENFTGAAVVINSTPGQSFGNIVFSNNQIVPYQTIAGPSIAVYNVFNLVFSNNDIGAPTTGYVAHFQFCNTVQWKGNSIRGSTGPHVQFVSCTGVSVDRPMEPQSLVDASTIDFDVTRGNNGKVTLGGNRTLDMIGEVPGEEGTLIAIQDGTGGRTLTLPGNSSGVNWQLAAGAVNNLEYFYDGSTFIWQSAGGIAITSINSHTGPAITIQGGTALSVDNSVANTVTFNVTPSSNSIPHTLDAIYTTAGNTGTGETDLFTYTLPAGKLAIDGRTVNFEIDGEFNDNTITAQLRLYFAGNVTLNTGAVSVSTAFSKWKITGYVMRTSSSTAHVTYEMQCPGLATTVFLGYSNLTSLDFTTTNVFKITAQAAGGGASNSDITAHSWQLLYKPQPQ